MNKEVAIIIGAMISNIGTLVEAHQAPGIINYVIKRQAQAVIDGISELKNNWPSIANPQNEEEALELDAVCKALKKTYNVY